MQIYSIIDTLSKFYIAKMTDFFKRLDKYMDVNGLNDNKMTIKAGLANGILGKARKRGSLSQDNISKILHACPDLDANWLFMGEGEMLNTYNDVLNEPPEVFKLKTDKLIENQRIPLYNAEAIAGVIPIFDDLVAQDPMDYLQIPNAPKCDGALIANGDSMYPLVKSGDYVGFKIIDDLLNDIFWGQMYILYIKVAGDVFRTIKFIHKGKSDQYIKLVSENKHHQEKEVQLAKVISIAQVKLLVRFT